MKGLTWKKIMSLVLVAALVIGCLQLNAKKVSANDEIPVTASFTADPHRQPTAAYTLDGESSTKPGTYTDVVLAIDASGSMNDWVKVNGSWTHRIDIAKQAAKDFVDTLLDPQKASSAYIRIAIVKYGKTATVVQKLTNDKSKLYTAINGLTANGGTNVDDAIEKAQKQLENGYASDVLVIFSDGQPTYANGTNGSLIGKGYNYTQNVKTATEAQATAAKNDNIKIYTVLCGAAAKEDDDVVSAADAMAAISSGEGYYFSSNSFGAASSILKTVGEDIGSKICTGFNARIEATLSSYVTYDGYTGTLKQGTTVSENAGKVIWGNFDIDAADIASPTLKFKVTAPIATLVEAANDANNKLVVWKDEAKTTISVAVTSETWLYYKKTATATTETAQQIEDSFTIDLVLGVDYVDYTVKYIIDEEEDKAQQKTGKVYVGDPIDVPAITLDNVDNYTVVYPTDKIAKANPTNNVLEVTADIKTVEVKFFDIDVEASTENNIVYQNTPVDTITFNYGDAIVDAAVVDKLIKNYKKDVTSGSAIEFTWQENWKNADGKVVELGTAEDDCITAFFANYGETDINYVNVVFIDEDGTVIKQDGHTYNDWYMLKVDPSDETEYAFAQYLPKNPEKDYDENQYEKYEFIGWFYGPEANAEKCEFSDVLRVSEDTVLYAHYDKPLKKYTVRYLYQVSETENEVFEKNETVEYGTKLATAVSDIAESAETKAIAYAADTLTKNDKINIWKFNGWNKTIGEDEIVTDNVDILASFVENGKHEYTVNYYFIVPGVEKEIALTNQKYTAGDKLNLVTADTYKTYEGKKYVLTEEEYELNEKKYFTGMEVTENLDIVFVYRNIKAGKFTFYKFESEIDSKETVLTLDFDEETKDTVYKPAGPVKAASATKEYNFKEWVTFMKYEDIEARMAKIREVVVADTVIAPEAAAGTKTEEGIWVTYDEYMENFFEIEDKEFYPTYTEKEIKNTPTGDPVITLPLIIITETPEEPTPTVEPTPEPTAEPTPTAEPEIEIEETETPEGDVDLEETETPQAAPEEEEELEVEPIDTPQGDLPQTGVTPSAVFFGIGAACVVFGGAIVIKLRRKEEM